MRWARRAARTPLPGRVAAGRPVLADEHIEANDPLPQEWTGSGKTFLLTVQGDSMRDALIVQADQGVMAATLFLEMSVSVRSTTKILDRL